jgi:PAS domain S-box-containing protein
MRVIDMDFNVLRINEAISSLSGIAKYEAVGNKCYDTFPGSECHTPNCPVTRILCGEQHVEYEVVKQRKDGFKIPCIVAATPFRKPDGEIIGIIENFKDITERNKIDQLKDEFIGLVSHELRSPLTVIIGAISTVLTEGERLSPEEIRLLLQDASLESEKLSHLLGNLLELSRAQAQRLSLFVEPISIIKTIEENMEKFKNQYPTYKFVKTLPKYLPLVPADQLRVERILYNLLENAVKYSPRGGTIRVFAKLNNDYLTVGVSDQGIGISESDQIKIFMPFQRIEDSKLDAVKGAGLGLLVCRRLIEAHKGKMWVTSKIGKGSTFFFTLPLAGASLTSI